MTSIIGQIAVGLLMGATFTTGSLAVASAISEGKEVVNYLTSKMMGPETPKQTHPDLKDLDYAINDRYGNLKHIVHKNI